MINQLIITWYLFSRQLWINVVRSWIFGLHKMILDCSFICTFLVSILHLFCLWILSQDNVSDLSYMSTCELLFQSTFTTLIVFILHKTNITIISLKCNIFSPLDSWIILAWCQTTITQFLIKCTGFELCTLNLFHSMMTVRPQCRRNNIQFRVGFVLFGK